MSEIFSTEYLAWLREIKAKIHSARIRITLAANTELLQFYWDLGASISHKLSVQKWGSKVVDQLSKDLRIKFPEMEGLSRTNLYYMRKFFDFFSSDPIVPQAGGQLSLTTEVQQSNELMSKTAIIPQPVGQLPWGHVKLILDKIKTIPDAQFYVNATLDNNWSREVLALQIKSELHKRQGKAITNFARTLPEPQSDLAQQLIKDPYRFDFVEMTGPYNERDIELQLVQHVEKFMLELGKGFAFIGRQYPLEVGDKDYYLDLLFYHIRLRCFVVIELKNTAFIPEYAGKLNFYLSAVDDLVKHPEDQPTIGILLCRDKNKLETEFALRGMSQAIGVSEFSLTEILPEELKGSMPTIEELERGLGHL